ncbi:MAG: hypothetical protein Q7S05_00435 [bacterium]|nr:hypothetical protein [bacterium]
MSKSRSRGRIIDLRKGIGNRPPASGRARPVPAPHQKVSLRTRRRKVRALLAFIALVALGGLVWGASALSYSQKFVIRDIAVQGTKEVPASLVRAYVETALYDGTNPLLARNNIFLYPRESIEEGISKYFPRIRTAKISREALLAQAITVTVAERQPFALWCGKVPDGANDCYMMDDTGFVFASATSSPEFIVFGGALATSSSPIGQTFMPEYFPSALQFLKKLVLAGFSPVSVFAKDEQEFSVQLKKGFELRALWSDDANTLVRNLELALSSDSLRGKESKLEYVDLCFGNRLYYKLKGQAPSIGR